jgi:hypothetical protein
MLLDVLLISFISSAAAYSLWVWQGKPNSDTGEYSAGMIFSNVARWLLTKHHQSANELTIYKIALCPYCLAVWVAFVVSLLMQVSFISLVLAALTTAPFVSLFLFIDNKL